MKNRCIEIILVEPDDDLADMIVSHVESALDARVARFGTAGEAGVLGVRIAEMDWLTAVPVGADRGAEALAARAVVLADGRGVDCADAWRDPIELALASSA